MNILLNELLKLHNDITLDIDFKQKIISKLYKGNEIIEENLTFEQFSTLFTELEGLNQKTMEKLNLFFNNLDPNNEPFSITTSFEHENIDVIEIIRYEIKGVLKNNRLIMFFSNVNQKITDSFDPVTKVFTRDVITEKIKNEIEEKKPFSMIIVDIDNFKDFNNTHGHMFGDIILVETVASLKNALGPNDYIGRIGGDEFLIVIHTEHNAYEEIHSKCSSLKRAVYQLSDNNIKQATVTATLGCSVYPKDGESYDTLFLKCDKALYRGKKKGRNCFIIYSEELCGKIDDNSLVESYKDIENIDKTSSNSQVVLGIYEILSRNDSIKKNLTDALSLIGNFFLIERIHFQLLQLGEEKNIKLEWIEPHSKRYANLIESKEEFRHLWYEKLDKTGKIKLNQVKKEHSNIPFFKILLDEKTKSILGFQLKYTEKEIGFLRFDTCSYTKFWQEDDINSLMIISKIIAVTINRFNEQHTLKKYMFHDQLTGLYTYNKFKGVVSNRINHSNYAIIYFDLVDFREVNHAYGTDYGDKVLYIFGRALESCTNDNDVFCRITEDRFLLYTETHDKEEIINTIEKIKKYIISHIPFSDKVILKAGIRLATSEEPFNEALDRAFVCLKKSTNTNSYVFYENFIEEQYELENEIKAHMLEGIKNNEFLLYLQPKVEIKTKRIIGAEALSRWNFKEETLLYPDLYIPIFEKMGLINELDYYMFEKVCQLLKDLQDKNKEPICISLNASRFQTELDKYIQTIESIRKKYGISPELIEIEITERMYLNNIQTVADLVNKLHKLKYRVAMDDFGSGSSNLVSLVQLDFDVIKLDRSLCTGKDIEKEKHILTFIKQMTNNLNVSVLAEGIENEEIAKLLETLGYEVGQGYLYDKPLFIYEFIEKYLN